MSWRSKGTCSNILNNGSPRSKSSPFVFPLLPSGLRSQMPLVLQSWGQRHAVTVLSSLRGLCPSECLLQNTAASCSVAWPRRPSSSRLPICFPSCQADPRSPPPSVSLLLQEQKSLISSAGCDLPYGNPKTRGRRSRLHHRSSWHPVRVGAKQTCRWHRKHCRSRCCPPLLQRFHQ